MTSTSFGLIAEFETPEALTAAVTAARAAGYAVMDAFSPFAVEGLDEALGLSGSRVPLWTLIGGLCGGTGAYGMQWYAAVVSYPINVGGRPFHSAPSFIPITFEMTVLFAALSAVLSLFLLNGLPRLYHPVFNVARFARASQDRFFLCIETRDARFDLVGTRAFLAGMGGTVYDVER